MPYRQNWGRPATDAEKLIELKVAIKRDKELLYSQINELVEALFHKYRKSPDVQSRKLLIAHMGMEFFKRTREE